jgi:hypothetical protein
MLGFDGDVTPIRSPKRRARARIDPTLPVRRCRRGDRRERVGVRDQGAAAPRSEKHARRGGAAAELQSGDASGNDVARAASALAAAVSAA